MLVRRQENHPQYQGQSRSCESDALQSWHLTHEEPCWWSHDTQQLEPLILCCRRNEALCLLIAQHLARNSQLARTGTWSAAEFIIKPQAVYVTRRHRLQVREPDNKAMCLTAGPDNSCAEHWPDDSCTGQKSDNSCVGHEPVDIHHSFRSVSYDRSIASSKDSSLHSAI